MADFSRAFNSWFDRKVENLNRRTFRALDESMKEGEEITQTFIATRGTAGTGKQGRVDTGKMLDSVGSEAKLLNSDEAEGRFGWLNEQPFYAEFQEAGTQYIEPMYALSDAAEITIQELERKLGDAIKGA
jgi:hypothetical protein